MDTKQLIALIDEKLPPVLKSVETEYCEIDNAGEDYNKRAVDYVSEIIDENCITAEKDTDYFAIYIGYGFAVGGVKTSKGVEPMVEQHGFREWNYVEFDIRNEVGDSLAENDKTSKGLSFMKWLSYGDSGSEIATIVFQKIMNRLVRKCTDLSSGKHKQVVYVSVPPVSTQCCPNWEMVFQDIRTDTDTEFRIIERATSYKIRENERLYVVFNQKFDKKSVLEEENIDDIQLIPDKENAAIQLAEVFERNNLNETSMVGAFAFCPENGLTVLYSSLQQMIKVSGKEQKASEARKIRKLEPCIVKYGVSEKELISFLSSHRPTFSEVLYTKLGNSGSSIGQKIQKAFGNNQSAMAKTICGRIYGNNNFNRISLGDSAAVCIEMENPKFYTFSDVKTRSESKKVASMDFPGVDLSGLAFLPANYSECTWKLAPGIKPPLKYFSMGKETKNKYSLQDHLITIIARFDDCSTEQAAEELLYFLKDAGDPSALCTALLFKYMIGREEFILDRVSSPIETENIEDRKEYAPVSIQKKKALVSKLEIIKWKETKNQENSKYSIKIADLGLSVRAYNCLKRANLNTVGEIVSYAKNNDLLKVRNLGNRSVQEVTNKLKSMGIFL